MSEGVKPCAHCAKPGIEVEQRRGDFREWSIECSGCCCRTDWYGSLEYAIAAWNTRADDVPEHPVDNAQADSRERLRADVYEGFSAVDLPEQMRDVLRSRVHTWLDRQAAITSSEWCYSHDALEEELERVRAERDELSNTVDKLIRRVDGLFCLNDLSDKRIKELEAEVEAQRKRANDAERGVLSDEWYVCRDRYDDDIAELKADVKKWADAANEQRLVAMEQADKVQELTAERDRLKRRVESQDAYIANVEDNLCRYASQLVRNSRDFDKLTAERNELRDKLDEKQHVCDTQRESFRKMEQLLADAKAADYVAMRDEAEMLSAENARLKAENRELHMKVHGAPF